MNQIEHGTWGFVLLGGATLIAPGLARGQATAEQQTPMKAPPGFEPVPGGKPKADAANASLLVMGAYSAFALGFVGYLLYLARMQSRLSSEINRLSEQLTRFEDQSS